jgi:hypothetical protein
MNYIPMDYASRAARVVDFIEYIYWDRLLNIYYDMKGNRILNIYTRLTPSDIYLFRHDPRFCTFHHRDNPKVLCEILIRE